MCSSPMPWEGGASSAPASSSRVCRQRSLACSSHGAQGLSPSRRRGDERGVAPGEALRRGWCAGGLIELLRELTTSGCEGLNRPHDGIAALDGEPRQFLAIGSGLTRAEALPEARVRRHDGDLPPAAHCLREAEIEFRRCERREIPGATAVVAVIRVAAHGRPAAFGAVAVDGVCGFEELLERGQK